MTHSLVTHFFTHATAAGATRPFAEHMVAVLIVEIALILLVGRLLGEVMQRVGQPAVMGQLIAGIVLGPSVLGAFWPAASQAIFPDLPEQKKMLEAISQLGVLMLLLLTGMETDLALVKRMGRSALSASLAGVVFPFACGFLLGQLLPETLLPDPSQRLAMALFLATALSISSVKIVAMVLMEVDFMRRNIGQIILASAILDDTLGWILIALIAGLAAQGTVQLGALTVKVLGTLLFLALSLTVGRRIVAYVIRWTNDHLSIEMPVITAILILMCLMAFVTDYIGVHTVLGAFVAGILVGQSPILTRHIEEQLRGLILALFAPIFFAVAGLSIDLRILKNAGLIKLALGLILVASLGKLVGCYIGGRLGRLSAREATALAIGMNARGSTEVMMATIGLSMGVLSRDLFTLIVVMAIVTTMMTPPLLRWALARIPPSVEEKERLEREAATAKDFLPKIERLLVAVDRSPHGELASRLAGLFAGTRQIMATVLELASDPSVPPAGAPARAADIVKQAVEWGSHQTLKEKEEAPAVTPSLLVAQPAAAEEPAMAVLNEAKKGYDMLFLGLAPALSPGAPSDPFHGAVAKILENFPGVTALVIAREPRQAEQLPHPMKILIPTTGTDYSRRAAEVAIALAKASRSRVTALHISPPADETVLLHRPPEVLNTGYALVHDLQALGQREGVGVIPMVKLRRNPEAALLRQVERGQYHLVVLGVKVRAGERLFFGHTATLLWERASCSLMMVHS
jgi:Kef-type K+ transport system membrane component KefB/nucleotide-binding universal stress UspA family protein